MQPTPRDEGAPPAAGTAISIGAVVERTASLEKRDAQYLVRFSIEIRGARMVACFIDPVVLGGSAWRSVVPESKPLTFYATPGGSSHISVQGGRVVFCVRGNGSAPEMTQSGSGGSGSIEIALSAELCREVFEDVAQQVDLIRAQREK